MSNDRNRRPYSRERDRNWDRNDYRSRPPISSRKRSRTPARNDSDKRRSRSPRKIDKDLLDENILSEISKLPEPSELWDSQFQDSGFAPPPPSFQQENTSSSNYGSNYGGSYQHAYEDFPPVASLPPAPLPPEISSWNQMSLPPAPPAPPAPFINNVEDQIKKEAAIESEMRHQKAALSKQREDYMKKAAILKKELDTLKDQRNELRGDSKRSPSPDTKRFLKENTKLQLEIQNKLKTINNVVDMLNGIIGEEAQDIIRDSDDSADRSTKRKSRSPSKFNYVYYDPEMHWCRVCNEFPSTAKDYLNHLHSPQHHKMAAQHMEAPWHSLTGMNEGFPSYPSAPTKRTPIRGLQFFVPSTAWYCKLCDLFIGDLHCASAHLKSIGHSKNYTNFVEQNPHWETDWMSDRQKAFEKVRTNKVREKPEEKLQYTAHTITFNKDGFHTKRKESPTVPEEKKKKKDKKKKIKKKKSSSSSSSDSSSSESEPVKKKKAKSKQMKKIDPDDKTLTEWMSSIQVDRLNDSDRKLLDNLKNKIKQDSREEQRRAGDSHDRDRSRSDVHRKLREIDRREARGEDRESRGESRDSRGEGRDTRGEGRDARGEERESRRSARESRRGTPPLAEPKKPEKKMPFIGKMPVYKNLAKNIKADEKNLEEQKKKEEEDVKRKRQQELDVEIQKKVAEFKEKIAKAQLERAQAELPPPALALPAALSAPPPHYLLPPPVPMSAPGPMPGPVPMQAPAPQPQPNQPPNPQQPNLPKDFQDALDIIFPSEAKKAEMAQQDIFAAMPPFPMGGPLGGPLMPPFPPLGLMQPRMPQMNFGFDMNGPLFPPRPQLYDSQVPLLPPSSPRPQNKINKRPQNQKQNNRHGQSNSNNGPNNQNNRVGQDLTANKNTSALSKQEKENAAKKKEELDDLAMLGIDASDVGAGI